MKYPAANSLQSRPTPRDPIDGSPLGSSIHWIFQARVLEWGAIAFSDKVSQPHCMHGKTESNLPKITELETDGGWDTKTVLQTQSRYLLKKKKL